MKHGAKLLLELLSILPTLHPQTEPLTPIGVISVIRQENGLSLLR